MHEKPCTKPQSRAEAVPNKTQQWLWFIGLWCAGLGSVLLMSYGIKLLF